MVRYILHQMGERFTWAATPNVLQIDRGTANMILMHALEAPYDLPGIDIRRGDEMFHLLSDLPGAAGTAELLAFARRCGAHDSWLQAAGTYREHFDIFGEWADMARELGARRASGAEVASVLAAKRAAATTTRLAVPSVTGRQMRAIDRLMAADQGIAPATLIELAGLRLAQFIQSLGSFGSVVFLIGPGRTGASGLAAARHLAQNGGDVRAVAVSQRGSLLDHASARSLAVDDTRVSLEFGSDPDLTDATWVIDALLGYGIAGTPYGPVARAIVTANNAAKPIIALDLPSGLDPDEGGPHMPCIQATHTLTLTLPKRGLSLAARDIIGEVWLADLGVPRRLLKRVGVRAAPYFAERSIVALTRVPLAGSLLASDFGHWVTDPMG